MRASVVSDFSYFFSTKPRDWRGGNVSEMTWHAIGMGRQTTTQSNQSINRDARRIGLSSATGVQDAVVVCRARSETTAAYRYYMTVSPLDGKLYVSDHQTRRILRVKTMGPVRDLTRNYEVLRVVAPPGGVTSDLPSPSLDSDWIQGRI